jgi:mannose-1-phosphate guanylyltransferase
MTRQLAASEVKENLWALILAGEDGTGLHSRPSGTLGNDRRPVQSPIDGSLLRQTLDRARLAVPWKRTVVVSNGSHEVHLAPEFPIRRAPRLRLQTRGGGSAMDVLVATHWIRRQQDDAIIAILPSEQVVLEPRAFMRHVVAMAEFVARHPREIVIAGARPTYPETRYGWIETAQAISDSGAEPVFRVRSLRHGLSYSLARACYESGALWNTSVIVARAEALLRASRRQSPELDARLQTAMAFIGTPYEQRTLEDCYAVAHESSFSDAVLAGAPRMLAATQLPPVHWSIETNTGLAGRPPAPRGRFDGLVEQYSLEANVEACREKRAMSPASPWRAKPRETSSHEHLGGEGPNATPSARVNPAAEQRIS